MTFTEDGYAVAPTTDDHLAKIAIPIRGRDPIKVEVPRLNWMPPEDIKKYRGWLDPLMEIQQKAEKWAAENEKLPEDEQAPKDWDQKALDDFSMSETTLRWLKPYVSAAEYRTLVDKCPSGTVDWIAKELRKSDDPIAADLGESSASTDS